MHGQVLLEGLLDAGQEGVYSLLALGAGRCSGDVQKTDYGVPVIVVLQGLSLRELRRALLWPSQQLPRIPWSFFTHLRDAQGKWWCQRPPCGLQRSVLPPARRP